jgi:hypothetical protein
MIDGGRDDQGLFPRSVGEELATVRLEQKLETTDIAARTRIPVRHIEAIERGDHDALPALPYAAGFVKAYGNMLGLDGQALSNRFRVEVGEPQQSLFDPEAYEPADPARVPSRMLAMVALGVAVLLTMGYLLLRFEGDNSDMAKLAADTPAEIAQPVKRKPVPPSAPALAQSAAPSGPIAVTAIEDAWVRISERDGPNLFMGVMKAGDSFPVPDTASDPVLRTGRPQSIKVMIGPTALPPIGEPDHLVKNFSLKRDALTAIATAPLGSVAPAPTSDGMAAISPAPDAAVAAEPVSTAPRPRLRRGLRHSRAADGDAAGDPPAVSPDTPTT